MDKGPRRLIGLCIVLSVLLVSIFPGPARGRVIGGEGVARPLGSAPEVGDCLVNNFRDAGVDLSDWGPDLPAVETSQCTGPRFGEVVYVQEHLASGVVTEPAADPYDRCGAAAEQYVGVPAGPVIDSTGPVPSTAAHPALFSTTAV